VRVRIENEFSLSLFSKYDNIVDTILEYEISGNGTIESPFSFTPTSISEPLYTIKIWDSKAYINFIDQKLYGLSFYNCSNISIRNSELKYLYLENCNHINLDTINVKKETKIISSENIKIATLKSDALYINACLTTVLINSAINKFYQVERSDLIVKNTIVKKHKTM